MNNFTKQLETFESPEDYAEFKKAFFSKENKEYMKHVQDMEDKYKTKNFEKVLDKMNNREYNKYSDLFKTNPIFNKNQLTKNAKSDKIPSKTSRYIVLTDDKFIKYSLNPEVAPDKAEAFKSALGYDKKNYEELKRKIREKIDETKFVEKGDSGYGMTYEYIMNIEGANGKKANVLTAWIQDGENKRLTSVYVTKKKVTE